MARPSNWVNPADYIGTYATNPTGSTTAPYPGNPEIFSYDPERVGGGIAQYYGTVSSALPTFAPIQRNIAGIVSPEEKRLVGQAAAERGIGIGSYGGGNDLTGYLRAMGTTSRELTNRGIEQYGKMMATIPALSPQSLFISPSDLARLNLDWSRSQAEINAAMARTREQEKGALERAKISERTAYGTTNLSNASRERLAANQLAAEAQFNEARRAEAAAALDYRNRMALAQNYGIGGYSSADPWAGGVNAPASSAGGGGYDSVYNSFGLPGYTGSTGSFYAGEAFGSPAEEYAYMQGGYDPYSEWLNQDYFQPGEMAYVYETGNLPTPEDYYYGFE